MAGPDGESTLPVADLVVAPHRTALPAGSLITHFSFPRLPEGARSAFVKLGRRNAQAISRLSIAAAAQLDSEGAIAFIRVAAGAATPKAQRMTEVEEVLLGRRPSPELLTAAGCKAAEVMLSVTGRRWSTEYKEIAIQGLVETALSRVLRATRLPAEREHRHMLIEFTLNGGRIAVDVPADVTLLTLLRDYLDLTGTKCGCEVGECGACSVLVDGLLVNSCLMLAPKVSGRSVVTIEGVSPADGSLSDLQASFIAHGAVQCGFCTPGMVLAGEAVLASTPLPTRDEIRTAISGNLCRCTGYQQIVDAVEAVAHERAVRAAPLPAAATWEVA